VFRPSRAVEQERSTLRLILRVRHAGEHAPVFRPSRAVEQGRLTLRLMLRVRHAGEHAPVTRSNYARQVYEFAN
jgi:hypothetical protein